MGVVHSSGSLSNQPGKVACSVEQWLATPLTNKVARWLRSTEVVHFLGKEEVSGPNPLGASIIVTMRYRGFYVLWWGIGYGDEVAGAEMSATILSTLLSKG